VVFPSILRILASDRAVRINRKKYRRSPVLHREKAQAAQSGRPKSPSPSWSCFTALPLLVGRSTERPPGRTRAIWALPIERLESLLFHEWRTGEPTVLLSVNPDRAIRGKYPEDGRKHHQPLVPLLDLKALHLAARLPRRRMIPEILLFAFRAERPRRPGVLDLLPGDSRIVTSRSDDFRIL